jgi:hypothetical protein
MAEWLVYVLWMTTFVVILYQFMRSTASSGLMVCYWIILGMNHFFGHFLLSSSSLQEFYYEKQISVLGFEVSGYALLGLLSSIVFHAIFLRSRKPAIKLGVVDHLAIANRAKTMDHFATSCIGFGILVFALGALGVYEYLPSSSAVSSSAQLLVISGILMKWWVARNASSRQRRTLRWLWLILIFFYPFYTTLVQGFIGFGITAVLIFGCFLWRRIKNRSILLVFFPFIIYAGLMLWTSYAQVRNDVRAQIGLNTSAANRFEVFFNGVYENFSWIDPDNPKHLVALGRLNQNSLVGESVRHLEQNNGRSGQGETFVDAFLALIPRVLWPGKPQYGGGGGLVTRYTGVVFAEGTAVGIGQIMECYVNYGRWFVFGMFFGLGLILKYLDAAIDISFVQYRPAALLIQFMVGINWLNVIGCFSETFPAIIGSVVLATITIVLHNVISPRHRV